MAIHDANTVSLLSPSISGSDLKSKQSRYITKDMRFNNGQWFHYKEKRLIEHPPLYWLTDSRLFEAYGLEMNK